MTAKRRTEVVEFDTVVAGDHPVGLCVSDKPHQWLETGRQHKTFADSAVSSVRDVYCPNCDTLVAVPYFKYGKRTERGSTGP